MGEESQQPDAEAQQLIDAGAERDEVLGQLLDGHRDRLMRMVRMRMDPKLKARVGASDVLQEAFVEIYERVGEYLDKPQMPFFLWVRFLTAQKILRLYRFHVKAQKRDVRRQAVPGHKDFPDASPETFVQHLMAQGTTPSYAAMREEMRGQLLEALEEMGPQDREVLVLRHYERLSNEEVAEELGLSKYAASKRYIRALDRIRSVLESQ